MVEIDNTTILEYELTGLFWWWWYDIYIGGYTKMGTGVTLNVTVRTDEESKSLFVLFVPCLIIGALYRTVLRNIQCVLCILSQQMAN